MATENDEYNEYNSCIDKLNVIAYLIDCTACATTGDDVKYAKEALFFLSDRMSETIKDLEAYEKLINKKHIQD